MVDEEFLKGLFNKYDETKDRDLVFKALEEKEKEQETERLISQFTDALNLAEQVLELIPLYYDNSHIWWRWDLVKLKWGIVDEIDILNNIDYSSPANIINSQKRTEILNALKSRARENKPKEPKLSWIQFDNEIVDLETGERFKPSPDYFMTNPIPYKLGSNDETPIIDKIFNEWVSPEYVKTLYEIMAYCMLPDYPINRFFVLIGGGSNGKSCFLNILKKFIGCENCSSTELDLLINSRFESSRKLFKKLVCQIGEINFNQLVKTSVLKRATGEDLMGFEMKNKPSFDGVNYAKIIIATNNLPTTTDKTDGFYRRCLIVDFPNQFTEKLDILNTIPQEEYNNLSCKLVSILMDLLKEREFSNQGSIEERRKRYEEHSNPIDKFFKENIKEDCNKHIFKYDFKQTLTDWCKKNKFREFTDKAISKYMKEKELDTQKITAEFYNQDGNKPRYHAWIGISWIDG